MNLIKTMYFKVIIFKLVENLSIYKFIVDESV